MITYFRDFLKCLEPCARIVVWPFSMFLAIVSVWRLLSLLPTSAWWYLIFTLSLFIVASAVIFFSEIFNRGHRGGNL